MSLRFFTLLFLVVLMSALVPAVQAAGVTVVGTVVSDNGDDDGFADTQETVTVRLILRNPSAEDLTGLTVRLSTTDSAVACLTVSEIVVPSLPAGAELVTEDGFVFVVASGVQRLAAADSLTVKFAVTIHPTVVGVEAPVRFVEMDLDLDVSGGAGPTTFFESFESGFGAFTTMHLDESLNPPDSDLANRQAGVINADDHRCQYHDPEWWTNPACGASCPEQCFPSPNGAPDAFYFHVVTDRAYSGLQSMGYNVFLGEALGYTTPNSQLEAIRTIDPVNLAWSKTCTTSGADCEFDADCPAGEACSRAAPRLSFKHQISLLDHRSVAGAQPDRTADRAVVSVQLADDTGAAVGPWIKAYPFTNIYDSQANSNYFNCSFDPADDGNTEEDFFDPSDPIRSQGPSSTCAPEFSFAHQGDTDALFDIADVGDAEPGAGLEGEYGIGTWVEPLINLERFRGRRVRIRFLETGLKLGGAYTWEQAFEFNPDPGDDGWFFDDVTVTDALSVPAIPVPDTRDNSFLPYDLGGDAEADGIFDVCDNCPATANLDQGDRDSDGIGDACDACPDDRDNDGDGDGLCLARDNCPGIANAEQDDADGDGVGDPCDTCRFDPNSSQALDEDEDGVLCPADNCRLPNPGQEDGDADGVGDPCDACPDDPRNDPDDDQVCGLVDSCPFVANPSQGPWVELVRSASGFALSPDGAFIVGRSSVDSHLWSQPAHPAARVVPLSQPFVADFAITSDGAFVVYRRYLGERALYSVPIAGGTTRRLSPDLGDAPVEEFVVSDDGSRVAFRMQVGDSEEIFSAPTSGGPSVWLSPPGPPNTQSASLRISPDGSRVIYVRAFDELYSVPIDGGPVVRLTPGVAHGAAAFNIEFSPDSSRVLYHGDFDRDLVFELYSVPADGSAPAVKLNPAFAGNQDVGSPFQVPPYVISPDSSTVLYLADPTTDGREELYRVPIQGGPAVKIGLPGPWPGDVREFALTPDGSRVILVAETQASNSDELLAVPTAGGQAMYLADWGPGQRISPFRITPDGRRVVYRRTGGGDALFAVTLLDGATLPLSPDPVALIDYLHVSADGSLVVYREDFDLRLYGVAIEGGTRVELNDGEYAEISSAPDTAADGSVVYWYSGNNVVAATWLMPDADGDGLHAACDCDEAYPGFAEANDGVDSQCPGDPGFGLIDELSDPAGFLDPGEPDRYAWPSQPAATGYEVIRAGDAAFTTDCVCTATEATNLLIAETPPPGARYFYLPRSTSPNRGSPGADSAGVERDGACLNETCGATRAHTKARR